VVSTPTPRVPRSYPGTSSHDDWSPTTSVQSGSGPAHAHSGGHSGYEPGGYQPSGYSSAGYEPAHQDRPLPPELDPRRNRVQTRAPATHRSDASAVAEAKPQERGLPSWGALLVLLVIAGIGGIIDEISGASVRGGFNIGIIVASIVAILVVRRSGMFPVVVAPPIVYAVASGLRLYVSSHGLHDKGQVLDAASNWLVYGFPAIAGATAAVLIIAGIRLIARR
jgi:fumarate reductase subunit D